MTGEISESKKKMQTVFCIYHIRQVIKKLGIQQDSGKYTLFLHFAFKLKKKNKIAIQSQNLQIASGRESHLLEKKKFFFNYV